MLQKFEDLNSVHLKIQTFKFFGDPNNIYKRGSLACAARLAGTVYRVALRAPGVTLYSLFWEFVYFI